MGDRDQEQSGGEAERQAPAVAAEGAESGELKPLRVEEPDQRAEQAGGEEQEHVAEGEDQGLVRVHGFRKERRNQVERLIVDHGIGGRGRGAGQDHRGGDAFAHGGGRQAVRPAGRGHGPA